MGYPRKQATVVSRPSHGEAGQGFINRSQANNIESRNRWQDEHKRVHYCCYGGFPCYICPLWDNVDTVIDYAQSVSTKLRKLHQELYFNQKTPSSIGKWTPRALHT